ncbi:hypothetical protein [Roseivirga sp.]|uniref:hypothetical protein n=1 Tax=Roseivirga sp. TaxID=1964215 RepID=UPI003B51B6A2
MRRQTFLSIICLIGFLNAVECRGQIQNIPVNEDVTIDRLYFGLLSEALVQTKDLKQSGHLTVQAGTRVKWSLIPDRLVIRSFGVFQLVGGQEVKSFTNFESILSPGKRWNIHVGVMATPTTELRPNPSTWQSQVETHAESTILGGRPGVKVRYTFMNHLELVSGVHIQNEEPAYHLKLAYKALTLSGFISANDSFLAMKWKDGLSDIVVTYDNDSVAFSGFLNVFDSVSFYTDLVYAVEGDKKISGTWGMRKYVLSEGLVEGFFSLSYNQLRKQFQAGFFLHI